MKKFKIFLVFTIIIGMGMVFSGAVNILLANGSVYPDFVEGELRPGESMEVTKEITTSEIPPVVDICLLEDETGSFWDDIDNLQSGTTASDLYNAITAESPDAQFAVTGFRDYPIPDYGSPGDHVYRLLSSMSPDEADWLAGIAGLTAGGGCDTPEAQYDAIVAAAEPGTFNDPTLGEQLNCGWRNSADTPGVQRVLVVATDAPFHLPDGTHINDAASTIAALQAQGIIVIGLKAGGAGDELDDLADATGGSVQELSSDGANIAAAILAGLEELTTDVWWEIYGTDCDEKNLLVELDPIVHEDVLGGATVNFTETITVDNNPSLQGKTLGCTVDFFANSYPEEGELIGSQEILIYVPDTTPPELNCIETVNPHGKKIPPAGSTTLPGSKGGINEDGFYELLVKDNLDETLEIWVTDDNGAGPFGPFNSGDKVKITESKGVTPKSKPIGSTNGKAGAISAHIMLNSDAVIYATDASGNKGTAYCMVPPPPK